MDAPAQAAGRKPPALISSTGFVLPGQERFHVNLAGGEGSFREILFDTDVASLTDTHRSESFDHRGMMLDPNLAFPIDRVRELAAAGRIGEVSPLHLSFMDRSPRRGG